MGPHEVGLEFFGRGWRIGRGMAARLDWEIWNAQSNGLAISKADSDWLLTINQ